MNSDEKLTKGAETNNINMILEALKARAEINYIKDDYSETALYLAVDKGHTEAAIYLIEEGKANIDAFTFHTPFHTATVNKDLEMMELLFKYKADVNLVKPGISNSCTPLHFAIIYGWDEGALYLINGCKAEVNTTDHSLDTPLLTASRNKNYEIMEALIAHGANVNEPGHRDTPLSCAIKNKHIEGVKLLFTHNANFTSIIKKYGVINELQQALLSIDYEDLRVCLHENPRISSNKIYGGICSLPLKNCQYPPELEKPVKTLYETYKLKSQAEIIFEKFFLNKNHEIIAIEGEYKNNIIFNNRLIHLCKNLVKNTILTTEDLKSLQAYTDGLIALENMGINIEKLKLELVESFLHIKEVKEIYDSLHISNETEETCKVIGEKFQNTFESESFE